MGSDRFSELERLWALKESGALTEEEFVRLKAKALGTATPNRAEEPVLQASPSMHSVTVSTERTTQTKSLKGCWTAIGLAVLALFVLVIVSPDGDPDSDNTMRANEVAEEPSPEEQRREEEKYRAEISKLRQEAAAVPTSDYEENERIYARLAELQPSDEDAKRKRDQYATKRRLAESYRINPEKALQITRMNWTKGGFGSIQLVSLTVKNDASFPIRDFELKCVHQGPSGTDMDRNIRTVYDRIPAGGSKYIREVNMGFIHPQVATSRCEITDAVAD